MRVLIIGGTGFVGKHIAQRLSNHEHEVIVFHRGQTQVRFPGNTREILDPSSTLPIRQFPRELLDLTPDTVIHT